MSTCKADNRVFAYHRTLPCYNLCSPKLYVEAFVDPMISSVGESAVSYKAHRISVI
jgi:hypothetical protein